MIYLLKTLLDTLKREFSDPEMPRARLEELLGHFGGGLVKLDGILRKRMATRRVSVKFGQQAEADMWTETSSDGPIAGSRAHITLTRLSNIFCPNAPASASTMRSARFFRRWRR